MILDPFRGRESLSISFESSLAAFDIDSNDRCFLSKNLSFLSLQNSTFSSTWIANLLFYDSRTTGRPMMIGLFVLERQLTLYLLRENIQLFHLYLEKRHTLSNLMNRYHFVDSWDVHFPRETLQYAAVFFNDSDIVFGVSESSSKNQVLSRSTF